MRTGLKDVLEGLDLDDLNKMKRDISSGGSHMMKILDAKIETKLKEQDMSCSVCGGQIEPNNLNNFTLIFGPHDFQRKATFCAVDCLEYFLTKLKGIRDV